MGFVRCTISTLLACCLTVVAAPTRAQQGGDPNENRAGLADREMRRPFNAAIDLNGIGAMGGLGFDQLLSFQITHMRDANAPDEDSDRTRHVTSFDLQGSMAVAPLPFRGRLGVDAGAGLSFPGGGYPGLFHLNIGPHVRPDFGGIPIALTIGLGVGAGTRDVHAYLYPRAALRLHRQLDAEVGFYFVHPKASHVTRGQGLEDAAIGYQRLRASIYITLQHPDDVDMPVGLRLYVQREAFSGRSEVLAEQQLRRGQYWGGGLGVVF